MPVSDQWASLLASLRQPGRGHEQLIRLALRLGHDIAAGTVGCSLTEIDGAGYRTPAASSPVALRLDQAQYAESSGPCVSAVRDRQVQRLDLIGADDRWPVFAAAALEHGVRSSLSYPVAGTAHPTALNVYSSTDAAFGSAHSVAIAALLARCIGALSPAPCTHAQNDPDDQAETRHAREQGQRVSDAVDHLMRRGALTRSEAFAELAERSRIEQSSINETAAREMTDERHAP